MVAFVIVVRDILTDRASQVALAERDHSMQTLELDGPHEPRSVPIWIALLVYAADR